MRLLLHCRTSVKGRLWLHILRKLMRRRVAPPPYTRQNLIMNRSQHSKEKAPRRTGRPIYSSTEGQGGFNEGKDSAGIVIPALQKRVKVLHVL